MPSELPQSTPNRILNSEFWCQNLGPTKKVAEVFSHWLAAQDW